MQVLIVDPEGDTFLNKGQFPFVDPTTQVRFEPGTAVQVKSNDWIAGQPVLEKQPKPKKG